MVSTPTPTPRALRPAILWQDRLLAFCWLPLNLLFDLWVALTPLYEEKWGLSLITPPRPHYMPAPRYSFGFLAIVTVCVLSLSLLMMHYLSPLVSRTLLVLSFGFCFWQAVRPKR